MKVTILFPAPTPNWSQNGHRIFRYDYFLSDDGTKCVSPHVHANSDALLAHIGRVGELLGPMVELRGGVEVVVLGDPSTELLEATAAFEPTVCAHLDGK